MTRMKTTIQISIFFVGYSIISLWKRLVSLIYLPWHLHPDSSFRNIPRLELNPMLAPSIRSSTQTVDYKFARCKRQLYIQQPVLEYYYTNGEWESNHRRFRRTVNGYVFGISAVQSDVLERSFICSSSCQSIGTNVGPMFGCYTRCLWHQQTSKGRLKWLRSYYYRNPPNHFQKVPWLLAT